MLQVPGCPLSRWFDFCMSSIACHTDNTVHLTLPAAPEGHADLSDEELMNAAGGTFTPESQLILLCWMIRYTRSPTDCPG
jgi:hypothetical protein